MTARNIPAGSPDDTTVLALSESEETRRSLERTCAGSRWKLQTVRTPDEAIAWMHLNPTPVVLCEEPSSNRGWLSLQEFGASLAEPPAIVVLSRHADNRLWAEVLNLGGFDVLQLPADRAEFFRTLSSAWRHCKNRLQHQEAPSQRALSCAC